MPVVFRKKVSAPVDKAQGDAVDDYQHPPLEVALKIAMTLARQAARRDHAARFSKGALQK